MKFLDKLKQKASAVIHATKDIGPLRQRNEELEIFLDRRIIKDRDTRNELRNVRKELERISQGAIPKEFLDASLKNIPLPIFYTQQDFVIVMQTAGAVEYFNRDIRGTKYSNMFVDSNEFQDYSEKADGLYLGESFDMNVTLKRPEPTKVYSKTTALPINLKEDKGYMIYLETIQPDPSTIEAEIAKEKGKLAKFLENLGIKPKPKPALQN